MRQVPGLPFPADPEAFAGKLLAFTGELVALGGCSTSPEELGPKAAWLADRLTALGLQVEREEGEFGPHLAAFPPGVPARGSTLLVGHYDTVYPSSSQGYQMERVGDRVVGPTVADMSGGLAVILGALELLGGEGGGALPPLKVLLCSDEERGSVSAAPFLRRHAKEAARALVFEGGRLGNGVVLGRRGREGLRLRVRGRTAHAGIDPEQGVNALAEAAALVEPMAAAARVRGASLVLGGETEVRPGAPNTVPGEAILSGDLRYEDPHVLAPLLADLEGLLPATPARRGGAVLPPNRLERTGGRPPWMPSAADRALFESYRETAARFGVTLRPLRAGGGSDANLLAAMELPVLDGLGPVGEGFHRLDESIDPATLLERTVAAAAFLAGSGGGAFSPS